MPGPSNKSGTKPKNAKLSLSRFLKSLKPFRWKIIIGIILTIASSVLSIFGPKLLGDMTNSAVVSFSETGHIDWSPLTAIAIELIILYVASGVCGYLQDIIFGIITAHYTQKLRLEILEKINKMPIVYFDRNKHGDVLSRMSNDVDVLANSLTEELSQIISSAITIIGILIIMFSISIPLSLIAIIAVPLSLIVVGKIMSKAQVYFATRQTTLGKLNSVIEEDYSGQIVIKSNSHEDESLKDFKKVNEELTHQTEKSEFLAHLAFPLTHIFTNLSYILICTIGGISVIKGNLPIGNLQSFIQYVNNFNRPITNLSDLTANIQLTLAAAERIFDFLNEKEEEPDQEQTVTLEKIKGLVEFKNVSFSYNKDKEIIHNFSAIAEPGHQIAIVGPTGAGKTTIINLLMRFYDPQNGEIIVDDTSTKNMRREDVRNLFGMVLQDTWLFSGTIEENLRYGNPKATLEDIKAAAKIANIDHFIESLPHGYHTMISEDSDNISAGEKQLLTIARAMVANPPMMILDEATSNVDTRTEQLIQTAFDKLTKNRTSFVIAHRLSTIRNADLILVMKDGKIIEQGKHNELLKQGGFYAELYNSQFSENIA